MCCHLMSRDMTFLVSGHGPGASHTCHGPFFPGLSLCVGLTRPVLDRTGKPCFSSQAFLLSSHWHHESQHPFPLQNGMPRPKALVLKEASQPRYLPPATEMQALNNPRRKLSYRPCVRVHTHTQRFLPVLPHSLARSLKHVHTHTFSHKCAFTHNHPLLDPPLQLQFSLPSASPQLQATVCRAALHCNP